ncbi:MAG: hypothetical protein ABIA63_00730 [bacterium]
MNKNLSLLLELNKFDKQINTFKNDQVNLPMEINRLKSEISSVENRHKESLEKLGALQRLKEETTSLVLEKKDSMIQSQEKLKVIQTNREYDAVHEEIENHERIIKNCDKKFSQLSSEIQELTEEIKILDEKLILIRKKNKPELNMLQSKLDTIQKKIDGEMEERKLIENQIDGKFLALYERIKKKPEKYECYRYCY